MPKQMDTLTDSARNDWTIALATNWIWSTEKGQKRKKTLGQCTSAHSSVCSTQCRWDQQQIGLIKRAIIDYRFSALLWLRVREWQVLYICSNRNSFLCCSWPVSCLKKSIAGKFASSVNHLILCRLFIVATLAINRANMAVGQTKLHEVPLFPSQIPSCLLAISEQASTY